uniref:Uncharacterized protein n=1 Tax=Chromera velia CCMP2878 TaxID=1169474 RepID=A0A0G4I0B3_9ALVE|eukprot:Cvel_9876.t1-p1 / transcript=Cvel_9876.t1 / gene=Cvel_9876 / organism=Chromera_velia_CCMP2878 / gene_product=Cornifelin homolog, putative / transcript_product=Cornifelin homolog, putative / location=Cvel_scaffold582:51952-57190(-) / protein_length=245 / sequence_SO=supercontig / SO=protein_coding / is_pseudo=false
MAATRLGENPTGLRGSKQWTCTSSSYSEGQETRLPCEGDGDDFNADLRAGCKWSVGEGLISLELAAKVRGGPRQAGSTGRLDSAWLAGRREGLCLIEELDDRAAPAAVGAEAVIAAGSIDSSLLANHVAHCPAPDGAAAGPAGLVPKLLVDLSGSTAGAEGSVQAVAVVGEAPEGGGNPGVGSVSHVVFCFEKGGKTRAPGSLGGSVVTLRWAVQTQIFLRTQLRAIQHLDQVNRREQQLRCTTD